MEILVVGLLVVIAYYGYKWVTRKKDESSTGSKAGGQNDTRPKPY